LTFDTSAATEDTPFSIGMVSDNNEVIYANFSLKPDATSAADFASAVNAINANSAKTGVTAEYYSGLSAEGGTPVSGIRLQHATGNDIRLEAKVGGFNAVTKDADGYYTTETAIAEDGFGTINGTVTYDSENSFTVTDASALGATATAQASTLNSVSELDVSTFEGAQLSLAIVDAAINLVNKEMARYGALQARFEATISNLEVNSENTSNARARIMDADYAQETAALSRASILQQAGTAMLAQANQMPQSVLSLIGG
jgi:flagellin